MSSIKGAIHIKMLVTASTKKIAIALDDAEIPTQTFVHYHIANLQNGETVVISRKNPISPVYPEKTFIYGRISKRFPQILAYEHFRRRRREQFRQFIEDNNVGSILAEFGYSGLLVYKDAKRIGVPLFVYFRGADASSWLSNAKYVRRLRAMMDSIEGVFAVSQSLLDNLHARGVKHRNEWVLPSGVDTAVFAPGRKDPGLIGSVGRFIGKKGHGMSIRAFARISSEFPEHRLEIVGEGELLESCRQLAERKGVADRVVFHREQSHEFVRDLLSRSTLYLQHSLTDSRAETEGIPTALQEAMSCGCVVLATRHAGIPEHVRDGVNGMLVDEGDVDAYTETLRTVLRDAQLRNRLAASARAYAVSRLDKRIVTGVLERILTGTAALDSVFPAGPAGGIDE